MIQPSSSVATVPDQPSGSPSKESGLVPCVVGAGFSDTGRVGQSRWLCKSNRV